MINPILLCVPTHRTIDIDALLVEVGEFGRYQKCYIFLLGLALLFTASSTLSFVFTTGDMKYRYFFFFFFSPKHLSDHWVNLTDSVSGGDPKLFLCYNFSQYSKIKCTKRFSCAYYNRRMVNSY